MNLPTYHALSSQPVTPADAVAVSDDCYALLYYGAHLVLNPPAHPNSRVLLIMTKNHRASVTEVLEDAKRRSFEITDCADLLRRSHAELADALYTLGSEARAAIKILEEGDRSSVRECLSPIVVALRLVTHLDRQARLPR